MGKGIDQRKMSSYCSGSSSWAIPGAKGNNLWGPSLRATQGTESIANGERTKLEGNGSELMQMPLVSSNRKPQPTNLS